MCKNTFTATSRLMFNWITGLYRLAKLTCKTSHYCGGLSSSSGSQCTILPVSLPSLRKIVALPAISTVSSLWHHDLHLLQFQLCGTEPLWGAFPWSLQVTPRFLEVIALSLNFSPKTCLWLVKKLLWLPRISVQILTAASLRKNPDQILLALLSLWMSTTVWSKSC